MIIKTTVDLVEVSNGIPQKIRFNNKLFIPEQLSKTPITHSPKKRRYKKRKHSHKNTPKPADKGEAICMFSGINMFSNVVRDVTDIISRSNYQNRDIRLAIKKYYPDNKMSSLDTKLYVIIRYIKNQTVKKER